MELARIGVAGSALVTVVVGAVTAGCGGSNNASPTDSVTSSRSAAPSTSSSVASPSPGQRMDYSALLIKPTDIGGDLTAPQPPVLNPNNAPGVAQLFASADNSRRIGDSILIVADPATAAAGIDNTKANYGGKVNGTWQPVDVGSNGRMISGYFARQLPSGDGAAIQRGQGIGQPRIRQRAQRSDRFGHGHRYRAQAGRRDQAGPAQLAPAAPTPGRAIADRKQHTWRSSPPTDAECLCPHRFWPPEPWRGRASVGAGAPRSGFSGFR